MIQFDNCMQFLIVLLLGISPYSGHSLATPAADNDSVVYVWDFSVSDPTLKTVAGMLTNDFETELINSGLYTVLERRRFNRVLAQQDLQDKIAEIQNLPAVSMDSLKAIRAGVVIFGEVKDDIDSGVYEVTVIFQKLNEVILRKGSILIGRGLIADNQTRKKFMKDLVEQVHSKERMAAKKEQYDLVSKILAAYMLRVKDVQKDFQDIARFALKDQAYFNELAETIFAYNDIFSDINDNRGQYQMDFNKEWKEPAGPELEEIFQGILDNIHKTYILKLDKVKTAIWDYSESKAGQSEKKKMKDKIISDVRETTDDLKRQLDVMDLKINIFLAHLKDKMREQD